MPSSESSQPARASRLAALITAGAVVLVPLALGALYLAERPATTVAASPQAAGGASGMPTVEGAPEAARGDAPPSPAGTVVAGAAQGPVKGFQPPPEESIPDNEYGETIRLGELIFTQTGKYAAKYVGNDTFAGATQPVPVTVTGAAGRTRTATALTIRPRPVGLGERWRAIVKVRSATGTATGEVKLLIDGRRVAKRSLRDGRVRFVVTRLLRRGNHVVVAKYLGSATMAPSKDRARLRVVR